jgi:MoxR-like ATPase
MRRYHREPAILDAARRWRDRCLLDDGSILSGDHLWTLENLGYLDRYYVHNPDTSGRSFLDKLHDQLDPTPAVVKQLAAEILWLLYLGVSEKALTGGTKRLHIKRIWDWSGKRFPAGKPELEALDRGMANPGTAYHTHKWREYGFAIELARAFKQLDRTEQSRLIENPWDFAGWLETVESSAGRQFRHFVLALLFPEHFERIVTGGDKQKILRTFIPVIGGDAEEIDYRDRVAVDRALYSLRDRIEDAYDADPLDYYEEPLRSKWKKPRKGDPPSKGTSEAWYRERFGGARVWAISAGEGARLWDDFQTEQVAAIGWDYLGDLCGYASRDEIQAAMQAQQGGNPTNNSLACWQFAHEMRPGDFVLAKQGREVALGFGVVRSDYRFDDSRPEYQHVREVEWQRVGRWVFQEGHSIATKTLTDFSPYKETLQRIFETVEGDSLPSKGDLGEDAFTIDDAAKDVFLPREDLVRILDALGRKKNVILEGAPGVGKTYVARRLAWAWIGHKDNSRVEMVQFHQSYAYEDFVQGWRPRAEGGFELQDGIFHRFCHRAEQDPDHRYVFIIDEINRGNLSKVLGELMMLIESDKRGPQFAIPLTYSRSLEERFYVPENVYILGMMNTADRSLAMVDYALRRRFSFVRLPPAFASDGFTDHLAADGVPEPLVERIVERMTELNQVIAEDTRNLGPGFEIGHSYFVPGAEEEGRDEAWYERVVRQEIEPLLHEYWFDQPQRVEEQIGRLLA